MILFNSDNSKEEEAMYFSKTVLLILLLSVTIPGTVPAAENGWLVGVWVLSDDSKEEFLEFTDDSTVSLISGKGRQVSGDYELTDSVVKIVYNFKGKKIPIDLSYNSARDLLSGNLSNTGKSVQYTKKQ